MNKRILSGIAATTFAATMAFAAPATAAVTFDPVNGTGFVGKGDVQLAFGWNNKQLQENAAGVGFTSETTTVSEVSWTCTNTNNEKTQERERTTTSTTSGVTSTITRDSKKQVTGFNLGGYSSSTSTDSTDGPAINTCPTNWHTTPAGDPVVVSQTGTLSATFGSQSEVVYTY